MTLVSLAALVLCAAPASPAAPPADPAATVRAFTEAFSRHDVEAMLALASPEVEWLSVEGAAVAVEAKGAVALRTSMARYFADVPTARSVVEDAVVNGAFVAVRERASWKAKDGSQRSQAALAVYELEGGKVRRVFYYPAQR